MIFDLGELNDIVKKQGLHVAVISYGGSCSNALNSQLKKNELKTHSPIWHSVVCHCPEFVQFDIPTIYVYDNPKKAFLSMKKRGMAFWGTNQKKLCNDNNVSLSDENLLCSMIKQFKSWTHKKRNDVLILKSGDLFKPCIKEKLETFLNKKLKGLPLKYKKPSTSSQDKVGDHLKRLFEKYKKDIDYINNFH